MGKKIENPRYMVVTTRVDLATLKAIPGDGEEAQGLSLEADRRNPGRRHEGEPHMCHELTRVIPFIGPVAGCIERPVPTPAELEQLLGSIGINVLADTIAQYWSPAERVAVLDYASAQYVAARPVPTRIVIPPVPAVLAPFVEASKAEESPAAKRVRLIKPSTDETYPIDDPLPIGSLGTIIEGTMDEPGMLMIQWDNGLLIPMFRSELEAL